VVAETLARMDRTATDWADDDPVESARRTDAAAREVADQVVAGLCAA